MQHSYSIQNQAGAAFRADLNDALTAIVSNNSGATEPNPSHAFQWWADTTSGILKQRNAANNEWISLFYLSSGEPINATPVLSEVPTSFRTHDVIIESGVVLRYMRWDGEKYVNRQSGDQQWLGIPVGVEFPLHKDAPRPPKNHPDFRYIELTAGLTGSGGYNEGVLSSETVSGAAPNIVAEAVVSLVTSALNGKSVRLINTTREFPRPGTASDAAQSSQNLAHTHLQEPNTLVNVGGTGWSYNASTANRKLGDATQSSGGDEARPRNFPKTYFMRIL